MTVGKMAVNGNQTCLYLSSKFRNTQIHIAYIYLTLFNQTGGVIWNRLVKFASHFVHLLIPIRNKKRIF